MQKLIGIFFVLFVSFFVVACGGDAGSEVEQINANDYATCSVRVSSNHKARIRMTGEDYVVDDDSPLCVNSHAGEIKYQLQVVVDEQTFIKFAGPGLIKVEAPSGDQTCADGLAECDVNVSVYGESMLILHVR